MNDYESYIEKVQDYYNRASTAVENPSTAVGWSSKETQDLRFLILSQIGDMTNKTVLDIGSGLGGLYPFINNRYDNITYKGIDVSKHMIERAKKHYPDADFELKDPVTSTSLKPHDYVIASGSFNIKPKDPKSYIQKTISTCYKLANHGFAFNLLSSEAPESYKLNLFHYYNPLEIVSFCQTLTPYVDLFQSYLPHDFTIFMYPKL